MAALTATRMEEKSEYRKGFWTVEEDKILMDYIRVHGKGKWNRIPKVTGLKRCGKSCRLRWINYLRTGVKRGDFSEEENDLIIRLHNLLGNRLVISFTTIFTHSFRTIMSFLVGGMVLHLRFGYKYQIGWSLIAGRVPGRTDNQVKNHWNTHLSKKLGIKKGKSKVSPSSQMLSREFRQSYRTSSDPNSTLPEGCDGGFVSQKVITGEGQSQNAVDVNDKVAQDLITMGNDYENSPWFFHNDLMELHSPDVMELLDQSLDFVWHGL